MVSSPMKRYTDINKTKTIFHNASVIQGALSPQNGKYRGNLTNQDFEQLPKPQDNSSLKFYISVAAIVILTSLYIYSEAKHNEDSVFFTMREIIELYIDQQLKEKQKEDALFQVPNLGGQVVQTSPLSTSTVSPQPTALPQPNATLPPTPGVNENAAFGAAGNPTTGILTGPTAGNISPTTSAQVQAAASSLTTTEQLSKGIATKAPSQTANEIFLYFPVIDEKKDKITFTALRHQQSKELKNLEYGNVIKDLIEQRSAQDNIYNFFNENIKVRRAWIDNDTLIIDFNRAFEYSRHGYAGLEIRIQQILWTAFHLPPLYDSRKIKNNKPIEYVSFLIGGRRKSKIGGDGMALSPFYSKEDLLKEINLTK